MPLCACLLAWDPVQLLRTMQKASEQPACFASLPAFLAAYKEADKKVAESVSRIGIISLVSAQDVASATPPGAPPGLGVRRDSSAAIRGDPSNPGAGGALAAAQPKQRLGLLAAALELSGPAYAAPLVVMAEDNQKLLLLAAFLQVIPIADV